MIENIESGQEEYLLKNGFPAWNNNPEVFEINREAAHSTLIPYRQLLEFFAEEDKNNEAASFYSLNGKWKFNFSENPAGREKKFYQKDYNSDSWAEIMVPGHWQLQGYDYPQYTNINYPWEERENIEAPFAPTEYNPVGSYLKTFELPEGWEDSPVYISFQGVESAFYIWLNGEFVGYSEDSFTPAEFNLGPYLKKGENKIAVEVYRWSDASWLEDQDFWRLSGIFRDVYLYKASDIRIRDYFVRTDFDSDYRDALLKVEIEIATYNNHYPEDLQFELQLYDQNNKAILNKKQPQTLSGLKQQDLKFNFEFQVKNPLKWSAEKPNLYRLKIIIKDSAKEILDQVECQIGFREFKIEAGIMKLNGKTIVFKGVNRHDFDCQKGRAVNYEDMLADIKLMKRNNINAVRSSHYPNSPLWYELCDQYGLYVIDEMNLETHGTWALEDADPEDAIPGSKEEWTEAVLDRANSMFQRDKNHPSILIWSLGNESYGGNNFFELHKFFKNTDPNRVVHYEGVFNQREFDSVSDIESQMYTSIEDIKKYAESEPEKPFLLCEYSHAMGNSLGNLDKYWELFDQYEFLQGGFIWDWIDQGILTENEAGNLYFAYGGDFGEKPNDGNFCGNGLLFSDRSASPKLFEAKKCYQNIKIEAQDLAAAKIKISNEFLFTNLKEYDFCWQIDKNGQIYEAGKLEIELEAEKNNCFNIPYQIENFTEAGEYILTISFLLKNDNDWAKKGHKIAFEQFKLLDIKADPKLLESDLDVLTADFDQFEFSDKKESELSLRKSEGDLLVKGLDFKISFNRVSGELYSYLYQGREFLKEAVKPVFWRAVTDNDKGNKLSERLAVWKHCGRNKKLVFKQFQTGEKVELTFHYLLPEVNSSLLILNYQINKNGEIKVDYTFEAAQRLPEIPLIGLNFQVSSDFKKLSWYGRGPQENYWDRSWGAKVGIYNSTVAEQLTPYLRPQESGNKTGVRWFKLSEQSEKTVLKVRAEKEIEMKVLPYTTEEITEADHYYQLPESDKVVVEVNYLQMGVGGDDSWQAKTHPEYTIYPNRIYSYSFTLSVDVDL